MTHASSDALFNFPEDAPVSRFGRAAERILQSSAPGLILYLNAHRRLAPKDPGRNGQSEPERTRWPTWWATVGRPYSSGSFDLLYVADLWGGEPSHATQHAKETLSALLDTDRFVGVVNLDPAIIDFYPKLSQAVDSGQLVLIDPYAGLGGLRLAAIEAEGLKRAPGFHHNVEAYLDPGLGLADRTHRAEMEVWVRSRIWERLRAGLRAPVVLLRDPLSPFGMTAAWHETERDTHLVSFQHGVVSGVHTYIPVLGSVHLVYGSRSRAVTDELNKSIAGRLMHRHATLEPLGNYVYPTNVSRSGTDTSLLILDQCTTWSENYYGFGQQLDELRELAAWSLATDLISRVAIRPHPRNSEVGRWLKLKDEFGDRVTISHPAVALSTDLASASAAVSLFSGAAIAAALNYIPTLLIGRDGRPWTSDLADFQNVTVSATDAREWLASMMIDADSATELANESFSAANRYFDGKPYERLSGEMLEPFL